MASTMVSRLRRDMELLRPADIEAEDTEDAGLGILVSTGSTSIMAGWRSMKNLCKDKRNFKKGNFFLILA